MSNAAWGALTSVFVALFGAGGYLQWRRATRSVTPVPIASPAQAKAGIETLLPVINDLQQRLSDAEEAQLEMLILLAAHGEWDRRIFIEIKKIDPDFPLPPPLSRSTGDEEQ